jgi:hypothetical protein
MSDHPIIFSAPMIRALLEGRKTQTRRILKPQPLYRTDRNKRIYADGDYRKSWREGFDDDLRFAAGDRLWARESFADLCDTGIGHRPTPTSPIQRAAYMADTSPGSHDDQARKDYGIKWKPSIHMPRWASRLTLIVESVKVERLQEISEEDAIAEGIRRSPHGNGDQWMDYPEGSSAAGWLDPIISFQTLWESINGFGSWDHNPFVAAISFRVVNANIDTLAQAAT